jgi:protein-histidine N-methyltransferase
MSQVFTDSICREPVNSNQRLALDYRNRQYAVLSSASRKIETRLDSALNFSSFCQHTNHASSKSENEQLAYMHQHVELLSLECAFEWLNLNYLDIFNTIIKMIAEDQAEALPLDWAILVEDWDHTYWTVWIFTVCILWVRDEKEFIYRHEKLSTWLSHMNQ